MAFDGNGNWISNFSAVADRNADIKILASRFDNIFIADIAQSFEDCLTKDAQVKPTTNFDANNFRIIDVANPVADNDAVNLATLNDRIAKVEQDPILAYKWSDYEIAEQSWIRADTFSWHDGTVYTNAYTHLYNDIQDVTSSTENIGSYTITYYQAEDGHKIVMADQETTVQNIYSESGVAWYYILDTANQRFKLPRTKFGFTGLRDSVGKYVQAGLPNITGTFQKDQILVGDPGEATGCISSVVSVGAYNLQGGYGSNSVYRVNIDASKSNSIYGNSSTVQPPATQMYLYFYVGQFTQSATEQTAGLNSSLFNGKADIDLSNAAPNASASAKETIVGWGMPDYSAGISVSTTSGYVYTAPKDGYFIISCNLSNTYVYCVVDILDDNNNIVINGTGNMVRYQGSSGSIASFSIPLPKGYKVKISEVSGVNQCAFYPMKGA